MINGGIINTGAAAAEDCTTDTIDYPVANTAYYQLNGGTGTTVTDETGTYNGTSTNVTYAAGKFDDAAVFNGGASYVDLNSAVLPSAVFSVSLWINLNSLSTGWLFSQYTPSVNGRFVFNVTPTGGFQINVSSTNSLGSTNTPVITTGNWHHVVVVKDGSNGWKLYADGQYHSNWISTLNIITNQNTILGGDNSVTGSNMNGSMDQVRIFNTAITAGQVADLYQEKQCVLTTLNPSDISNGSLSAGNLRFTSTATPWSLCRTIVGVTSGKYYFEMYVHIATNNSLGIGIAESTLSMSGSLWGQSAGGINYYGQNGVVFENGASILTYSTYGVGTTLMCAFDMTSGKIWFGKNGTWFGNPANGTSPASSNIKNYITTAKPFANAYYVGNSVEMNFGSGNSVNSGGFTYTPPSGFGPILS